MSGCKAVTPPMGRYAVDDTTVMVVFFDKLEEGKGAQGVSKVASGEKKSWWKPW